MGKLGSVSDRVFRGIRQFSAKHQDFVQQSVLDNGATLVSQRRFMDRHIDFYVFVMGGSFEDPQDKEGIGHFLEHLLIDKDVHREFSKRHGNIGLWTSCQNIMLGGKLPYSAENEDYACATIAEFLQGKSINEAAFIREKRRILNEIGIGSDKPGVKVSKLLSAAFSGNRSDANIIGTKDGIRHTQLEDLKAYHSDWFVGENISIGVTGPFGHDAIKGKLEKALVDVPNKPCLPLTISSLIPGDHRHPKPDLEQLYFKICFAIPEGNTRSFQVHNLAAGFLSNRIQDEVVFSGLVYDAGVRAYFSPYRPGYLEINGNVMPEDADQVLPEIGRVITTSITDFNEELFDVAKGNALHGYRQPKLWHPLYDAQNLAAFSHFEGRIVPMAEREAIIEDIQADDVHRYLVDQVFSNDPAIVTLGDDTRLGRYEDFAEPIRSALAKTNLPCPK